MQSQTASYVITQLLEPPASYTLTTLANIKDELGLNSSDTSNDATLTRMLNEESAGIARYCNRVFGLATWQDVYRPQRGVWGEGVRSALNPLKLTRWPFQGPVVEIIGNTYEGEQLVDGIASLQGLAVDQLFSGPGIPSGATITGLGSGSITISEAATESNSAIALSAGISVVETIDGNDIGLAAGSGFEVQAGSLLPGDEGPGMLYRLNEAGNPRTWAAVQVTVIYQAGYQLPNDDTPNMPLDLQRVCEQILVGRFKSKGRDPKIVERSQSGQVGLERFWVGAAPGQRGPYPNEILDVLDRYRVPVVASA